MSHPDMPVRAALRLACAEVEGAGGSYKKLALSRASSAASLPPSRPASATALAAPAGARGAGRRPSGGGGGVSGGGVDAALLAHKLSMASSTAVSSLCRVPPPVAPAAAGSLDSGSGGGSGGGEDGSSPGSSSGTLEDAPGAGAHGGGGSDAGDSFCTALEGEWPEEAPGEEAALCDAAGAAPARGKAAGRDQPWRLKLPRRAGGAESATDDGGAAAGEASGRRRRASKLSRALRGAGRASRLTHAPPQNNTLDLIRTLSSTLVPARRPLLARGLDRWHTYSPPHHARPCPWRRQRHTHAQPQIPSVPATCRPPRVHACILAPRHPFCTYICGLLQRRAPRAAANGPSTQGAVQTRKCNSPKQRLLTQNALNSNGAASGSHAAAVTAAALL